MRGLHWEIILVQYLEMREGFLMEVHMVIILEDLSYGLLLVSQMGSLPKILG